MEYLPCSDQDTCRLQDTVRGCFEDIHHLFYPRADYQTPTEKAFRQLPDNKILSCRARHEETHAVLPFVDKPSLDVMREALEQSKLRRGYAND